MEHGFSSEDLEIDWGELLESFQLFERRYKSLLGECIKPEADLKSLVHNMSVLGDKIKPLSCLEGCGSDVKREIPNILAGVYTLFTVLTSGASYIRIESAGEASTICEKLLIKPHNIQVLTLLYMLGCGSLSTGSLESQLMQIRTGEGKSMILIKLYADSENV